MLYAAWGGGQIGRTSIAAIQPPSAAALAACCLLLPCPKHTLGAQSHTRNTRMKNTRAQRPHTLMTGSGNSMRSSSTGFFSSHSVSPVMTSLRPAMAMMSPARASLTSSRELACICGCVGVGWGGVGQGGVGAGWVGVRGCRRKRGGVAAAAGGKQWLLAAAPCSPLQPPAAPRSPPQPPATPCPTRCDATRPAYPRARTCISRPMRSFLPLAALRAYDPASITPE